MEILDGIYGVNALIACYLLVAAWKRPDKLERFLVLLLMAGMLATQFLRNGM